MTTHDTDASKRLVRGKDFELGNKRGGTELPQPVTFASLLAEMPHRTVYDGVLTARQMELGHADNPKFCERCKLESLERRFKAVLDEEPGAWVENYAYAMQEWVKKLAALLGEPRT